MSTWTTLAPAAGVVVGGLVTGVATLASQALTDHRTQKRELAKRREDVLIRRYEIERETLLELQEKIDKQVFGAAHAFTGGFNEGEPRSYFEADAAIRTLASRCLDRKAADAVIELLVYCRALLDDRSALASYDTLTEVHARTQDLLGMALRRDPFQ